MTDERKSLTFQIKIEPSAYERIKVAADRRGLSAAAYIRQAVYIQLDADGIPHQKPKRKP